MTDEDAERFEIPTFKGTNLELAAMLVQFPAALGELAREGSANDDESNNGIAIAAFLALGVWLKARGIPLPPLEEL